MLPSYGTGFARMKRRLGPERAEELRLETIRHQQEARAKVLGLDQPPPRDRASYREYPAPRQGKKLTLERVNQELARRGHAENLVRGRGYFYFSEGRASSWPATAVYVNRLDALTLEQWINEYHRLRCGAQPLGGTDGKACD